MDLIAEMVLGYADAELELKVRTQGIEDYQILRYRDDYRIFTNDSSDADYILKALAEVAIELGLKLNASKTERSEQVITSSVKRDKLAWVFRRQWDRDLQKNLFIIHDHSLQHSNSGTLVRALRRFYGRLRKVKSESRAMQMISIVVDIAYRNPRVYPASTAILSKLLTFLKP